jgi:hypothetical protein
VSVASKLSKMRALSAVERRLVVTSAALLPVIALGLRVLGLSRVLQLLGRPVAPARGEDIDVERIALLVSMAASNLPFEPTCLTRSVLLQWLLRRCGRDGALRIGVRRPGESQLSAHAWVECDGVPVGDPRTPRDYAPFEARL